MMLFSGTKCQPVCLPHIYIFFKFSCVNVSEGRHLHAGTNSFVFSVSRSEGKMCCLSVHVDTSDSICVCVQLVVFCVYYACVCVCVCVTLSPIYLENGYVWPILPDFLALGKQTDSHSLCIVLKRWRLLVLERDLGLLVFDLHVVSV